MAIFYGQLYSDTSYSPSTDGTNYIHNLLTKSQVGDYLEDVFGFEDTNSTDVYDGIGTFFTRQPFIHGDTEAFKANELVTRALFWDQFNQNGAGVAMWDLVVTTVAKHLRPGSAIGNERVQQWMALASNYVAGSIRSNAVAYASKLRKKGDRLKKAQFKLRARHDEVRHGGGAASESATHGGAGNTRKRGRYTDRTNTDQASADRANDDRANDDLRSSRNFWNAKRTKVENGGGGGGAAASSTPRPPQGPRGPAQEARDAAEHVRDAAAYEKAGKFELAGNHYSKAAECLTSGGNFGEAAKYLARAKLMEQHQQLLTHANDAKRYDRENNFELAEHNYSKAAEGLLLGGNVEQAEKYSARGKVMGQQRQQQQQQQMQHLHAAPHQQQQLGGGIALETAAQPQVNDDEGEDGGVLTMAEEGDSFELAANMAGLAIIQ